MLSCPQTTINYIAFTTKKKLDNNLPKEEIFLKDSMQAKCYIQKVYIVCRYMYIVNNKIVMFYNIMIYCDCVLTNVLLFLFLKLSQKMWANVNKHIMSNLLSLL